MNEEKKFENVTEFAEHVAKHLFDSVPELNESHQIEVRDVTKNNGRILTGIIIKANDSNIAPTIYMNDGFKRYLDGADVETLIESYLEVYEESKLSHDFSVDFFTDFEKVKDKLTLKLINAERNREMLESCPHILLHDLAAIFQVKVDTLECGNATITVRKEHAAMWNVGTASLLTYAKLNMEKKELFRIQSMLEVLYGAMCMSEDEVTSMDIMPMYVMTNESKVNGAVGMIFTEKLQAFAERHECNLIILPSSTHEIIILLDDGCADISGLAEIVKAVNDTEVREEDFLSDSVYYYDKDSRELQIADTKDRIEVKIA